MLFAAELHRYKHICNRNIQIMLKFIPFVLLLLSSCALFKKSENSTQSDSGKPSVVVSPPENKTEPRKQKVYHESRTKHFELIHTRLDVRFEWENSLMHGRATLTLSPTFYPQSSLVLDAKGMIIYGIHHGNQEFDFEYDGEQLTIQLDKTYLKSDTLTLSVIYTAQPDLRPVGGSQAIAGDKGLYFINPKGENPSKMPQIWTQGETESNSVWFPTIDAPNQKMTQDLYITVDQKYTSLSNGVLVSSTAIEGNQRTDHWQQKLAHAPYLTMMGIGEFAIIKDQWKRSDGKTIPVHYYVEPEWKEEAKAIFGKTPAMISYFSQITGFEYPWDKYHQIVVRDYVSGAMENTGAVIFGDFVYSTSGDLLDQNWDDIIAHELSHHWFGDLVTCESWSNLPMNESFATYFEVLWDEHDNGKQSGAYHLQSDKATYFKTAENENAHHNLIWFDYNDKEQMFDGHSYSKGACILHMLRSFLGDDAFFAGIKHYLHQHQYSTVEAHDLRLAFEAVSGMDLNWFFNQWFFAKGHPVLDVSHEKKGDSLYVTVAQKQDLKLFPLYRLPTSIRLDFASGRQEFNFQIKNEIETFVFAAQDSLLNFLIDPEHNLLAVWNYKKSDAHLEHQFLHAEHYLSRKQALTELAKRDSKQYAKHILAALDDDFFDVRLEALEQCNRLRKIHDSEVQNAVIKRIYEDEKATLRKAAMNFLYEFYPKHPDWLKLVNHVLENDKSSNCRGNALFLLGQLDTPSALSIAASWENEKSSTLRTAVCLLYAEHGQEAQYDYFVRTFKSSYLQSNDRMGAMIHFGKYLSRHKSIKMHQEAFLLLNQFVNTTGYEPLVLNFVFDQLHMKLSQDLKVLNEEIAAYEEAKDFVWSQRLQKDRAVLLEIIAVYGR